MDKQMWIWDELEKAASMLDRPDSHYEISKVMLQAARYGRCVEDQFMAKPAEMLLLNVSDSQRSAIEWAIKEASRLRDGGEKKRSLELLLQSAICGQHNLEQPKRS